MSLKVERAPRWLKVGKCEDIKFVQSFLEPKTGLMVFYLSQEPFLCRWGIFTLINSL